MLKEDMLGKTVTLEFTLENKIMKINDVVSGIYYSLTTSVIENITQAYINYTDV